jgi:hypothetical protein
MKQLQNEAGGAPSGLRIKPGACEECPKLKF